MQGLDVLRVDLTACGDSHGTLAEVRVEDWIEDIESAADHLNALTGQGRRLVLGVRFSAGLAIAARQIGNWSRVVLWDPILDGAEWLKAQREMRSSVGASVADQPWDVSGERASELLLQSVSVYRAPPCNVHDVRVIRTRHTCQTRKDWVSVDVEYDCRWQRATLDNLFAHPVVESITGAMTA
jgi:hypothetical protein